MDPVIDKITTARVGLLLRQPFFGNMATRLKIVDASEWCNTLATDGRHFYYNRDFINKLTPKKIEFGFAHEVLHCVFDHFGRTGVQHNRRLANIAQDFAVNQILIDEGIGERITEIKICYDSKYRGKAWEEIYDKLWEQADKIPLDAFIQGLGEMLDDHLEADGPGDGDEEAEGKGKPRLSKEDMQKIRDEIKEAMINAASAAGAGNVPAGVERLIKKMTEPKMDWREYLRLNIQSIIRNDYSFSRPNRKSWQTGAILPGMINAETVDVAVFVDMSGSISDADGMAFLSEIKGIMDQYQDYRIELATFDTRVYGHTVITQDNSEDLLTYQLKGGGGTDFMACWEFMKDNDIQPKRIVMFTDGYPCGSWGDPDYAETLFIVKGNKQAQSPFGQTVIYEKLG